MSQSRRMSIIEVAMNYAVGISLSWLITYFIMPIWGFQQGAVAASWATAIYTVVSVARSYILRRLFNRIGKR